MADSIGDEMKPRQLLSSDMLNKALEQMPDAVAEYVYALKYSHDRKSEALSEARVIADFMAHVVNGQDAEPLKSMAKEWLAKWG